jgi:hypothetical protein
MKPVEVVELIAGGSNSVQIEIIGAPVSGVHSGEKVLFLGRGVCPGSAASEICPT